MRILCGILRIFIFLKEFFRSNQALLERRSRHRLGVVAGEQLAFWNDNFLNRTRLNYFLNLLPLSEEFLFNVNIFWLSQKRLKAEQKSATVPVSET